VKRAGLVLVILLGGCRGGGEAGSGALLGRGSDRGFDVQACASELGGFLDALAFQEYVSALRAWDRCIESLECDLEDIEPNLQEHWAAASDKIAEAAAALEPE